MAERSNHQNAKSAGPPKASEQRLRWRKSSLKQDSTPQPSKSTATAEVVIDDAHQRLIAPSLVASLIDSRQMRQVRDRINDVHAEHASELADRQIEHATQRRVQQITLDGERKRSSLRARHNEISGQLSLRATELCGDAINQQLRMHQQQLKRIEDSQCEESDRHILALLVQQLTRQQITKIGIEHGSQTAMDEGHMTRDHASQ